ncbi:S-adenosyl-L-methionine-dependent methyltransferase [Glarea lozoyensis ATCC 20868]|uniref:S-adenosyl-L-methionine-dependent methyltransferase n=1 Tax=Glarea lozoyensis (strain ATCC 20868 / MF5171) TaxID=1116229 RepID=S3D032_GLAL2|nr:S-adenosyl-L-methionine-dependent methyltransferase [Glarea lozoyensis ATCC 20868]EPE25421.1 S-adenosyl-L-methionine-dependent methyltransferase [Glarea lozoyensis ATCC 20868]
MPSSLIPNAAYNKFNEVADYITDSIIPQEEYLTSTLRHNEQAGLDTIDVAPCDGKFLYLLVKMNKVKRILEVGTLGGYSAIWMAKALPEDGKIITCELESESAEIARENIRKAGFENKIEVKVGAAKDTLTKMSEAGKVEPFDMVFIDADKENNWTYYKWALDHASHVGTVLVVDNVVRRGRLVDADSTEPSIIGTRKLFAELKREKRVECTALQTVGAKGWDGLMISMVIE